MAYVKLDTAIMNSSLWIDRGVRDVFVTALMMAMPFELLEPAPQLEVDSLRETGFVVPPGWYGFVAAAGPGIIGRSLVPSEEGVEALRVLGNPDPDSRSQEFEGRRFVRINGGYIVLNFIKYRDKDHTNAERQRRFRERQKAAKERSPRAPRRLSGPDPNVGVWKGE